MPYIGEIGIVAFNFAPRGWSLCDGQVLPIEQNAALFSVLGTTYGGDGRVTFALPDLRGRAALQAGAAGAHLMPRRFGKRGGVGAVALQKEHLPAHGHDVRCKINFGESANPQDKYYAGDHNFDRQYTESENAFLESDAIEDVGGGRSHNNYQPVLVLNYMIAMQGSFPVRKR